MEEPLKEEDLFYARAKAVERDRESEKYHTIECLGVQLVILA